MHNLLHPEQEERRLDAVLPCLLSKPAREEGTDASQGRNLPTAKSLKDQGKPTAGHSTHHTFCLDPSFRAAVDGLSEALSSAPRGCGTVPLTPTPAQSLPEHGEQTHTLSLALSLPAQPFSTHFTKGGKELAVLCAAGSDLALGSSKEDIITSHPLRRVHGDGCYLRRQTIANSCEPMSHADTASAAQKCCRTKREVHERPRSSTRASLQAPLKWSSPSDLQQWRSARHGEVFN